MAKYSYEFKRKIVLEYIHGNTGYKALAKKYHIPDPWTIKNGLLLIRSMAKQLFADLARMQNTLLSLNFMR